MRLTETTRRREEREDDDVVILTPDQPTAVKENDVAAEVDQRKEDVCGKQGLRFRSIPLHARRLLISHPSVRNNRRRRMTRTRVT